MNLLSDLKLFIKVIKISLTEKYDEVLELTSWNSYSEATVRDKANTLYRNLTNGLDVGSQNTEHLKLRKTTAIFNCRFLVNNFKFSDFS